MATPEQLKIFEAELARLGLTPKSIPGGGLVTDPGGMEALVARARAFEPGATWHDVIPTLPKHWESDKPETWTSPYRPLGPYDHQELPTAPAIHIYWKSGGKERLESLVREARASGHPIHGADLVNVHSDSKLAHSDETHAFVVFSRGTNDHAMYVFGDWVEQQPDCEVATYYRLASEKYRDET